MDLPLIRWCVFAAAILSAAESQADPMVPDWAIAGSATHKQVPPPVGFHRESRTELRRIGMFDGVADVGAALVPGLARFDGGSRAYTLEAAGYNVWYTRDEFTYLWKRVAADTDATVAVTAQFPVPGGYYDRMAVIALRESLDDDAREVVTVLHGAGIIHLSSRAARGASLVRTWKEKVPPVTGALTQRFGVRKSGDTFQMLRADADGNLKPVGEPLHFHLTAPLYVGIGASSHQPAKRDTVVLSEVMMRR